MNGKIAGAFLLPFFCTLVYVSAGTNPLSADERLSSFYRSYLDSLVKECESTASSLNSSSANSKRIALAAIKADFIRKNGEHLVRELIEVGAENP
jgi:hypothetical protein